MYPCACVFFFSKLLNVVLMKVEGGGQFAVSVSKHRESISVLT